MPAFQIIDAAPNPNSRAAVNFGEGISEALKRAREKQDKDDALKEYFDSQQPKNAAPPPNQQSGKAPNNINEILDNINNHPDILAGQGIVEGQNPEANKINRTSAEKRARIALNFPEIEKALKPAAELDTFKSKESIKADVKSSGEYLKKINSIREGIPRKELSLRQIDEAIKTRSTKDFLGDQLASLTGIEGLRSAKGAQLLSATKEFFLSDLSSLPGVRANQFLEKALSSAFTDPARTQEANEMVAAGMRANLLLDKVKTEITGQLRSQYQNTLGYIPASIAEDVERYLGPYTKEIGDRWANDVQHIIESHDADLQKFDKNIKDPKKRKHIAKKYKLKEAIPGSVLDDTMGLLILDKYDDDVKKAEENAIKLGYKLPGKK